MGRETDDDHKIIKLIKDAQKYGIDLQLYMSDEELLKLAEDYHTDQEKIATEMFEEANFLGRDITMCHCLVKELKEIEQDRISKMEDEE